MEEWICKTVQQFYPDKGYSIKKRTGGETPPRKSPDYETSVDLWSDTIAMVWAFPYIPRLFYSSLNPFKDKQTVYSVFKRI